MIDWLGFYACSWINNMIFESTEEKQQTSHDKVKIIDGSVERIHEFLEEKIKKTQTYIENTGLAQIDEAEFAANTLKQHLVDSAVNTCSAQELMWQSMLGAVLGSCHKLSSPGRINRSDVEEALFLAKQYKTCVQVLSSVADYLDRVVMPVLANDGSSPNAYPELEADKAEDAFTIFSENLRHSNKDIRLLTLRILCHFETLSCNPSSEEHPPPKKKLKTSVVHKSLPKANVLQLLKTVEESLLTVSTEMELSRSITSIQTDLSDGRMHEAIWEPASDCLAVLIKNHTGAVWNDCLYSIV
ncbi:unnamed protein product [Thlaspi arvense]|uniref:Uncharacterized protein n=1 Tax=Thlaspi arvense TaxID=13288 RepID=A0AAU9R800_THLAR|nr:unnamed protein product [Thlaspi arvense]